MISYGLSNAFFWHWCGSESLKIPKLDLSAFVRCDERRDRWSDGAQPTSSPATSSPRFAAAELDLGYAPPDGHHAGVAESSSLFQRTLVLVTGDEISAVASGRLLYTRCRRLASRISFGMLNCSRTIDLPSATVIGLPSVSRSS